LFERYWQLKELLKKAIGVEIIELAGKIQRVIKSTPPT
jgi:hypothetical protein